MKVSHRATTVLICTILLLNGVSAAATETQYVSCKTTKGDIGIEIYPDWAPRGAQRFLDLVKDGFFQDIGLFRCVKKFLTQFGISDKKQYKHWHRESIKDDPNLNLGIKKHYISYAGGGPNTRSTQLFIAFEDQDFLGKAPWETPFGKVVRGTNVVDSWYTGYGEITPFKKNGVDQQQIYSQGNQYLRDNFPKLDYILSCEVTDKDFVASGSEHSGSTNTVQLLAPEEKSADAASGVVDAASVVDHNSRPEGLSAAHAAVDHAELAHNHNEVPQGVKEGGGDSVTDVVEHNQLPEGVGQAVESAQEEGAQLAAELNQVRAVEEIERPSEPEPEPEPEAKLQSELETNIVAEIESEESSEEQPQEQPPLVPEETAAATPKHQVHVASEVAAGTLSDPRDRQPADDNVYPSPQATGSADDEVDAVPEEAQREEPLRDADQAQLDRERLSRVVLPDAPLPKVAESPTDSVSFNRYLRMARYTLDAEAPVLYSHRFLFLTCVAVGAFFLYFAYGIHAAHNKIARSKKY